MFEPTRSNDDTAGHVRRAGDSEETSFSRLELLVMNRPDSIACSTCRGVHTGYAPVHSMTYTLLQNLYFINISLRNQCSGQNGYYSAQINKI